MRELATQQTYFAMRDPLLTTPYAVRLPKRVPIDSRHARHDFRPSIKIGGIRFFVISENDQIALVCEEWPSLCAYGENVPEAINGLIETLADASRAYLTPNETELSDKAKELAAFLRENLRA